MKAKNLTMPMQGKTACHVRMANPEKAEALLAKKDDDGNLEVNVDGKQVKAKIRKLEGDEEREFHKKVRLFS